MAKAPQEVEGEPTIRLENILGTLGDELQDFFFGCQIRSTSSMPIEKKITTDVDGKRQEKEPHEPALKTVKVRLEIPTGTKTLDGPKT